MFRDALQQKLYDMEKENPSINSYTSSLKEQIYFFSRKLFMRVQGDDDFTKMADSDRYVRYGHIGEHNKRDEEHKILTNGRTPELSDFIMSIKYNLDRVYREGRFLFTDMKHDYEACEQGKHCHIARKILGYDGSKPILSQEGSIENSEGWNIQDKNANLREFRNWRIYDSYDHEFF